MTSIYALNLFDLVDNDDYRAYIKEAGPLVEPYGGRVLEVGLLSDDAVSEGGRPRQVMVLVEWPSAEAFEAYKASPDHASLHALRESGTINYLWWAYDRLDDSRQLFNR